jgi:hypothetical protein
LINAAAHLRIVRLESIDCELLETNQGFGGYGRYSRAERCEAFSGEFMVKMNFLTSLVKILPLTRRSDILAEKFERTENPVLNFEEIVNRIQ